MNIYEKLMNIQEKLNVPKNQLNKFGGYNFRSCEDILESVKPLLKENKLVLQISDEIVPLGDRYYVRALATLIDTEDKDGNAMIRNVGYAREEENKKGMDASQVTGATSSYARKYALNGLFCIDDTKDADTNEYQSQQKNNQNNKTNSQQTRQNNQVRLITLAQQKRLFAIANGNNDVVKNVISRYGYTKTEQIKASDYDKICTEIESEILM